MPFPPTDQLKIYYLVVLPDHSLEEMTPFQGFSPGWADVDWALRAMAELPADVLEGLAPIDPLISQRMGGARPIDWTPVMIDALETLHAVSFSLFTVAFTGDAEVAARLEAWRVARGLDLLHVTSAKGSPGLPFADLSAEALIDHCRAVYAKRGQELDPERRATASTALEGWKPRALEPLALTKHGHNALTPNQMSLERAGRQLEPGEPFVGKDEADYDDRILEGARAVLSVRDRAGLLPMNRLTLLHPETYLAEPALYRQVYARSRRGGLEQDASASKMLRHLQAQRGFLMQTSSELVEAVSRQGLARAILRGRQSELSTFMSGVGLTAAQTISAVVRLSPAINHVFPAMENFARSIRSAKAEHRLKQPRLFDLVQRQLAAALGPRRLAFLSEEVTGPIKIISDAPIEWLPIGSLPLMLRFQTSRLNATPGNLLMGQLARTEVATLAPETLCNILVVTAFAPYDPLRGLLRGAIEALREAWQGRVRITFVDTTTVEAFEAALNKFRGAILIFDGHGAPDTGEGDGVGRLVFGDTEVDIWALRGRVRVPPVVILSACDTQGLDSPSHATVGNGFLALGAVTVTATLLPVGGTASAQFISRLIYRLAEFVPAALSARHRVLNWTEIMSGMQRMYLASELLDALVGPLVSMDSPRASLQTAANFAINSGNPRWFEALVADIAAHLGETVQAVEVRSQRVIARSEAIRYVQLGLPEHVLIDDGSVRDGLVPAHLRHYGFSDAQA